MRCFCFLFCRLFRLFSVLNTCILLLLQVAGSENKAVFTKSTAAANSASQESTKTTPVSSKTTAPASSSNSNTSKPSDPQQTQTQTQALHALSRLVTADELDVTVAKHPASLTARFLLVQQALSQVCARCSM